MSIQEALLVLPKHGPLFLNRQLSGPLTMLTTAVYPSYLARFGT